MWEKLDEIQLSAVAEVANIGLGHAATALSEMSGTSFTIECPSVKASLLSDLEEQECMGPCVAVTMPIDGDVDGHLAFFFPWESAQQLWMTLVGMQPETPDDIDELYASAMMEVGNVICSSFLNAIADMADLRLHATPPGLGVDYLLTLFSEICVEAELHHRIALTIQTVLRTHCGAVSGSCLIVPSQEGLATLLRALGLEVAA